jgi:hypothetical protein
MYVGQIFSLNIQSKISDTLKNFFLKRKPGFEHSHFLKKYVNCLFYTNATLSLVIIAYRS